MSALAPIPSPQAVRSQFPALESGFGFFENAGGSQVPKCVIDAMSGFMKDSYVQVGAGYPAADRATEVESQAHEFLLRMYGGERSGYMAIGPSSSALLYMLANCFGEKLQPGDEIVLHESAHEANANPWKRLERSGVKLKWWTVDPETGMSDLESLRSVITDRTKVVCVTHTSNLLGDVVDVAAVAKIAHEAGARVVVDSVAFASHRWLDADAWDVDFMVASHYKIYGPHMAGLYGKKEAWAELDGPNHFFLPNVKAKKFELGCLSYEGLAGILALQDYLCFLTGDSSCTRETIIKGFDVMHALELPVQNRFLDYLNSRSDIRLFGPSHRDEPRHPTFGFVHKTKKSSEIAAYVNRRNFGIRYGHMYAYHLCEKLGLNVDEGVVRVSMVHYNTVEELDQLIEILDEAMSR
ncbi:MAG: cysteine desulfurase-like protein [Fimbriimonadaceae bacterium]|nr:cysteine desulfurase-like protein [Fimbriimonadaceae bacterium]